jgi:hypothetical protein
MTPARSHSIFFLSLLAVTAGCPNSVPVTESCVNNPEAEHCQTDDDGEDTNPARIYVDPPFGVGFGCTELGCEEHQVIEIENRGDNPLHIELLRTSVDSSTEFSFALVADPSEEPNTDGSAVEVAAMPTKDNPLILQATERVYVQLTYIPVDASADQGALWIDWYDGTIPYEDVVMKREELPLSTRILGVPEADVLTPELNFGYTPLAETKTMTVQVQNTSAGNAILALEPAGLSATTSGSFQLLTLEQIYINPGEIAEIQVSFTPNDFDGYTGLLYIPTNDPNRPQLGVSLVGTAIEDPWMVILEPTDWVAEFGEIRVGEEGIEEITIQNLGGLPLIVTPHLPMGVEEGFGTNISVDFQLPSILPLEKYTIHVSSVPTAGGDLWGEMTFDTNDPTLPFDWVDLHSYGIAPTATVSDADLDFGQIVQTWTAPAQTVRIENGGTGELTVNAVEFEIGSSSQVRLASIPTLPVKLTGDDFIELSVFVEALSIGPANATLLVHTDAVDEPTTRITITAEVVSCETGCPVENGTPICDSGSCAIDSCQVSPEAYHDADEDFSTGCECIEDSGGDVGPACFSGKNVGPLGDNCSSNQSSTNRTGTLHSLDDEDLYHFFAEDAGDAFCDTFSDSFEVRVWLENAPAGLEFCYRYGESCGGENQRSCGHTNKTFAGGSWASDDNTHVTVWVRWSAGAAPMCGNYKINFRSKD